MKKIVKIIVALNLCYLIGCSTENKGSIEEGQLEMNNKREMEVKEMTATLEVTYFSSVGYGDVFNCKVIESNYPDGELSNLQLVIQAGSPFSDVINANLAPNKLKVNFTKTDRHYDRKIVPADGFVGNDSLVWEIVSIDQ